MSTRSCLGCRKLLACVEWASVSEALRKFAKTRGNLVRQPESPDRPRPEQSVTARVAEVLPAYCEDYEAGGAE
jgi:hypothetical protein